MTTTAVLAQAQQRLSNAELLADDPLWLTLIKVVVLFIVVMLTLALLVWAERRVLGRLQNRPGPNRAGPFGMLQSIADALKLSLKEDIRPARADKWVYIMAPIIGGIPPFLAMAVMPFGGEVTMFGVQTALQVVDLPVGVLVVLACSSVGVYSIVLAGWSSGSPYPLLGALRSAAQVISYEIAMGLSIVGVVLFAGSLSTADIAAAQSGGWFAWILPISFVIYLISMVGETNRAPFDLPEAESELVGGFHTEYTSLKFLMFFLAEYANMVVVSAFATTLFLGGGAVPWPLSAIADNALSSGYWPLLWFGLKTALLIFGFIWARAALPRLRYDQFMKFGWKVLVPLNLVWIVAVTALRVLRNAEGVTSGQRIVIIGVAVAVLVLGSLLLPGRQVADEEPQVPLAGSGYPLPPLDLTVPTPPRQRRTVRARAEQPREAVTASGKEAGDGNA
ncbi:NADH-quinone oxidoreductase subunit NuoH [Goodfellowiella coeruleoviolacea]|uniref:NADH-quinone oxidoreductase subunit H n=1 Tax=Goodfellowiella coeruleoviolacea TaxID=334858 RepID=A0AAE3GDU2_9PSEU|nr:NADH-quinone oxidoreductase subunit NuoH [Goodfellowiella coeruleoviolacea]MCP2165918.1 NADH dehydrogenase subunit H (EC 1.6.5.3) [Goodfellowiella coeruleoviolacea]